MASQFTLTAKKRDTTGTVHARRMRRLHDVVPAIMYGSGKSPLPLTLSHKALLKALEHKAFHTQIIALTIDGNTENVILRDLQMEPASTKVLHVDFLRVSAKEKLVMKVPLHFTGADIAPGVKQSGGVMTHLLSEVEIKCLPAHLPAAIDVDVSQMQLNEVLHLTDLVLPAKVELTALIHGESDNNTAVVSIHPARVAQEEPEDTDETPDANEQAEGDNNVSSSDGNNDNNK